MDIQKIINGFCNVLEDHEYPYNKFDVGNIVRDSLERKANLIELFRKHPNWDEDQLCIHFDRDFERKTDQNAMENFIYWLWDEAHNQLEPTDKVNVFGRVYDDKKNPLKQIIRKYEPDECYWWENGGLTLFNCLDYLPRETVLPEFTPEENGEKSWYEKALEAINKQNPKFNFRPGMKINRVLNKICVFYGLDKLEGYDAAFAKFSDGITPLKINRHTTISVNPIDFLLMSNGNSWQSCHYIGNAPEDAGCYSSGTISYMLGEDSFIVSIIDKDWPDDNLAVAPKINRQVFGYNDHQLLQSRLYPQNCDRGAGEIYRNLREMVEQIIADAEGESNRWVKAKSMNVIHDGTAYADWECFNTTAQYNLRGYEENDGLEPIRMDRQPVCIYCGENHWGEDNILCDDCYTEVAKIVYCQDCGRRIWMQEETPGEDYYYDEECGEYYCSSCRFECARCGGIHRRRYEVYISDIHETWCDECADWYAVRCDNCGEYHTQEDIVETDDGSFCHDCYNDLYAACAECGAMNLKDNMTEVGGKLVCDDCIEKMEEGESA